MPASQKPKTSYYYKLFRVKRNTGKVTTVSLCPLLVTRACKEIPGGLKEVGSLVRKSALEFEKGMFKSCSGYVRAELTREVEAALRRRKLAQAQALQAQQAQNARPELALAA